MRAPTRSLYTRIGPLQALNHGPLNATLTPKPYTTYKPSPEAPSTTQLLVGQVMGKVPTTAEIQEPHSFASLDWEGSKWRGGVLKILSFVFCASSTMRLTSWARLPESPKAQKASMPRFSQELCLSFLPSMADCVSWSTAFVQKPCRLFGIASF